MTTYTTSSDIRDMVIESLGEHVADFDVAAIVADLVWVSDYNGREFVNIPEGDDFWEIARRRDLTNPVAVKITPKSWVTPSF